MEIDSIFLISMFIVAGLGFILNSVLLYVIATRSHNDMKTYSIFLWLLAVLDDAACVALFVSAPRLKVTSKYFIIFYLSPICDYNRFICIVGYSVNIVTIVETFYVLSLSFWYRYRTLKGQLSRILIVRIILIITLILFVLFTVAFYIIHLPPIESYILLKEVEPYYNISIDEPILSAIFLKNSPFTILNIIILISVPITYTGILYCYRHICKILKESSTHLSPATLALNREMVKAITIQACFPLISAIANIVFMLMFYQIYTAKWMERLPLLFYNISTVSNPLVTMYYIKPYRQFILNIFNICKESKNGSSRQNGKVVAHPDFSVVAY